MKILNNLILPGWHGRPILADVHYKEDNTPKPVVIFSHGYKSFKDWGPFPYIANQFAEQGFIFVKFNFSHNGSTIHQVDEFADLEAFSMNNYSIELDDLQMVIEWLQYNNTIPCNEIDCSRIFLMGHSRGGGIAILKAAQSAVVKKIATLAAVAGFGRRILHGNQVAEWKKNDIMYVENKRTQQQLPHRYQFYQNFIDNKDALNIVAANRKLKIPQLIIHGTGDETIPFEEAIELHECNVQSELCPIEKTGHTFGSKHPFDQGTVPKTLELAIQKAISFFLS